MGGVLAFAFALFVRTFSFAPPILPGYPGDDIFPRLILGLIILCGASLFVRRLTERRAQARRGGAGSLAQIALQFGPGEMFALGLFGLSIIGI